MTDPGPSTPEPRVLCPTCGKRFRVDPQALTDRPDGAPARCSACGTGFRVRRTPAGLEVLPEIAATRADSTPGKATDGRPKRRPPVTTAKRAARRGGPRGGDRADDLSDDELSRVGAHIENNYVIEGQLRRQVNQNIVRLRDIGCYRGLRHRRGLPVRGQRTRTNARTRKGPKKTVAGKKGVKDLR